MNRLQAEDTDVAPRDPSKTNPQGAEDTGEAKVRPHSRSFQGCPAYALTQLKPIPAHTSGAGFDQALSCCQDTVLSSPRGTHHVQ